MKCSLLLQLEFEQTVKLNRWWEEGISGGHCCISNLHIGKYLPGISDNMWGNLCRTTWYNLYHIRTAQHNNQTIYKDYLGWNILFISQGSRPSGPCASGSSAMKSLSRNLKTLGTFLKPFNYESYF